MCSTFYHSIHTSTLAHTSTQTLQCKCYFFYINKYTYIHMFEHMYKWKYFDCWTCLTIQASKLSRSYNQIDSTYINIYIYFLTACLTYILYTYRYIHTLFLCNMCIILAIKTTLFIYIHIYVHASKHIQWTYY